LNEFTNRNVLSHVWRSLNEGEITIGFMGGSITDGRPRTNWPEPVAAWFSEQFPSAKICIENAAIGATGSDLAVFRAQRDIIDRGCDLVFIEYAVNDLFVGSEQRNKTRETLIRSILANGNCDVILVYTYHQDMYTAMMQAELPASVAEFEQLAEHYGIGSVWVGLHALNELKRGRFSWEEWLPDGLHPSTRGSLSYAQGVIAFLETESARYIQAESQAAPTSLPVPMFEGLWHSVSLLSLKAAYIEGPWVLKRWLHHVWIDQVLETSAVGAKLSFSFYGKGLALGMDFGWKTAEFNYRIDDSEWVFSDRARPEWLSDDGLFSFYLVSDSLQESDHRFELEVVHGNAPNCKGTNFRLGFIGVIRNL
jgi:hypothetical protein